MYSIGNDIVALKAVNAERTATPQFYNKILAGSELLLYQSNCPGIPFYQFIWLLWSVKEAAYKCLKRVRPELVFSPTRTVITNIISPSVLIDNFMAGIHQNGIDNAGSYQVEVLINSQTLYARSVIYDDELIHSIASFGADFSDIRWGLKRISATDPESQSIAVRAFLTEQFPGKVTKDNSGVPSLNIGDKQLPISFSHHGEWVAYALPTTLC